MFQHLTLTDFHTHFTGSLPLDFIWQEFLNNNVDLSSHKNTWNKIFNNLEYSSFLLLDYDDKKRLFNDFKSGVKNFFSYNKQENINLFFDLYSLFQSMTKSHQKDHMQSFYERGAYAIARSFFSEGVKNFELIAGPLTHKTETIERLSSMIEGFERFEKEQQLSCFNKIRLTFIRNRHGLLKNLSEQILVDIFDILEKKTSISNRIIGFDFSGFEDPKKVGNLLIYINEIMEFNKIQKKKGKPTYLISLHAGENLFDYQKEEYFYLFQEIIKYPISRIGHGTFLWIPKKFLSISGKEDKERHNLLKLLAQKNCIFEICPTANIKLTPLETYQEIPFNFFEEFRIKYTINTDNKSIFSTNLKQEYTLTKPKN